MHILIKISVYYFVSILVLLHGHTGESVPSFYTFYAR